LVRRVLSEPNHFRSDSSGVDESLKALRRRIEIMLAASDPFIASLAKDGDMWSKPIFEPTPDVPEPAR
jgi:hypothetical protein